MGERTTHRRVFKPRTTGAWILAVVIALSACGRSAHRAVPSRAAATILRGEDRREAGPVRPFLADPDPEVRARASLALGRIGRQEDVSRLVERLGDTDATVRATAAFALGLNADPDAAAPLRDALTDPDAPVRASAARALGRVDAPGNAAALVSLIRDDEGAPVREALYALWRLRDPATADAVLERTADPDPELRRAAAYCLMRMVGPAAVGATPVPGGTDLPPDARQKAAAALTVLAADGDGRIRELAARGLGGPDLPGAAGILVGLLDDPAWRVRVNVLISLRNLGGAFDPEVLSASLDDPSPNVRLAALGALAAGPAIASLEPRVERLLQAGEPPLQAAAVATLAAWRGAEFLPVLARLAGEPDPAVRAATAGILGGMPGAGAEALLRDQLNDDPRVAAAALAALGDRAGADRRALGIGGLRAADFTVRATAVGLLPDDDPSLLGRLRAAWADAARDPQNDVRVAVLRKAAAAPGGDADGLLDAIAREDPDWLVRRMAAAALEARGDLEAPDPGPLETGEGVSYYEAILREGERAPRAVIETDRGVVAIELFARDAPLTVRSFMSLVESGYFDGLTFHRVVPNFVVQGGDPRGDGWGGPGYQIRCELGPGPYGRGTVGMALDGRDTGGSQFFITHTPQPHLDARYTVFGRVVAGMDVVDRIVQGDRILRARIEEGEP